VRQSYRADEAVLETDLSRAIIPGVLDAEKAQVAKTISDYQFL
jgi:hypothetical protein